jgi:hypothetical protein
MSLSDSIPLDELELIAATYLFLFSYHWVIGLKDMVLFSPFPLDNIFFLLPGSRFGKRLGATEKKK